MHFENTVTLKAPLEDVWHFLSDHNNLLFCIRGVQRLDVIEPEKRYTAYVTEKVGPFKVNFAIDLEREVVEEFQHVRGKASGKDSRIAARFRQDGDLKMRRISNGETELLFSTDVSIFGKLATLGHWIIKKKADEAMDHFVKSIKSKLEKTEVKPC